MRLLQCHGAGKYSLTEDLSPSEVPPYAILSHTWGPDEVLFPDLSRAADEWQQKEGYRKIEFCTEQAKKHGIRHFWVDTCCIDKSNSIELQTAINSMFRWYRDAARCYVYMADVSKIDVSNEKEDPAWEKSFCGSRWFTRGWTLQELIAPKVVDFYSKEGIWLGDKSSLESIIRDTTSIPVTALRGTSLSEFTIAERESWVRDRQTKYEEDMAYSLLGIFGVFLPLIYGEGREEAQRRLREEVQKNVKGSSKEKFTITFSLSDVPEIQHFVARTGELGEIRSALSSDGSRRVVVLHGLGGIGKTQLAVAYIKRHKDEYSAIFWFNIKDENSVKQSYVKASRQILQQYPDAPSLQRLGSESTPDEAVEAVKAWLSLPGNTKWLAVFDNYDDAKCADAGNDTGVDINTFLPLAHHGAVIITTRLSQIDMGHSIRVTKMNSMEDGLKILSSTSGRTNLRGDADAERLVERLDGLPLALASAGAYLKRVSMSFANYLRHYDTSWSRLQQSTPNLGSYKDRTLCTTWQMSYLQVERQSALAAQLLRWWAYFDNQDMWFELISHKGKGGPPWFYELGDELCFNEAMGTLHDYGLVEVCTQAPGAIGSPGYSIHGCLHSWTVHVLNREKDALLRCLAIQCVGYSAPSKSQLGFSLLERRLLPHVKSACAVIDCGAKDTAWALSNLAALYVDQDMLVEAEDLQLRALAENERVHGPDHASSVELLDALGVVYAHQSRLDESESLLLRAIKVKEKLFGEDAQSTWRTMSNLASTYLRGNRTDDAEELYRKMGLSYHAQAPDASFISNMAFIYAERGDLQQAGVSLRITLDHQERELGTNHPKTLDTRSNLLRTYVLNGKLQEAEELGLKLLEGCEETWGQKSSKTLSAMSSLGVIYNSQGKLSQAEEMELRAFRGMEKTLGADHVDTLTVLANLGNVYLGQNRLAEAEDACRQALRRNERALRPDHSSTLFAVHTLGDLYLKRNRPHEAEAMFDRALEGRTKVLGRDHRSTLLTLGRLTRLYIAQDRLTEAEAACVRELDGSKTTFGDEDCRTLFAMSNLGLVLEKQGKRHAAESVHWKALRGAEAAYGPAHTATLFPMGNLAQFYMDEGRLDDAEVLYRRSLRCCVDEYGPEDESTLEAYAELGEVCRRSGKLEEAREMLAKALEGYERTMGAEERARSKEVARARESMAQCLEEQGLYRDAEG